MENLNKEIPPALKVVFFTNPHINEYNGDK